MHDHNLRGIVSTGKYPLGTPAIFDVRNKENVARNVNFTLPSSANLIWDPHVIQ